jgi:hypothetical protein
MCFLAFKVAVSLRLFVLTRSRDVVEGKRDFPVADIHVDVLLMEGVRQLRNVI